MMKVYRDFSDKRLGRAPRSIAIGIFDGVHRGHQKIIRRAKSEARRLGVRCLLITFDPHPEKILRPSLAHPILMSLPHRLRFFEKLGVDETLVVRFDEKISQLDHETFLRDRLLKRLGLRALTIGHDFRFGRGGKGDLIFLRRAAASGKFRLSIVGALMAGRQIISSTRIRRLIESGALRQAAGMLGRPVSVYGTVVRGRRRGRILGFPTANLDPHHETLPPSGVYAAWCDVDGKRLKGVIHVGARPTFGERDKSVEVHFFDFSGILYGRELEVVFGPYLRPIRRFSDRQLLVSAIQNDIRKSRNLFNRSSLPQA